MLYDLYISSKDWIKMQNWFCSLALYNPLEKGAEMFLVWSTTEKVIILMFDY